LRGVDSGVGDGVDRRPVDPPQGIRFVDVVIRRGKGNRSAIQHLSDEQIHQHTCPLGMHIRRADLSLRFGTDVPHLPGRTARLHNGQDVIGRIGDPV
jgi:hypothetical protein